MAGVDEIAGEQTAPAAELDDQAVAIAHRLEKLQHAGRAVVGVEPEPEVVDQREVGSVVGLVRRLHPAILTHPVLAASLPSNPARCPEAA